HQLTIAWIVLAFATTILVALGHLVWWIVLALFVGILDGLDGKQARIKVETSESGKLEHRFDSLFEVAWPSALAYHFYTTGQLAAAFIYLSVLLLAEALDGIGKAGVYSVSEKLLVEPGPFDRVVRLVGGRRNIYIWVLSVNDLEFQLVHYLFNNPQYQRLCNDMFAKFWTNAHRNESRFSEASCLVQKLYQANRQTKTGETSIDFLECDIDIREGDNETDLFPI